MVPDVSVVVRITVVNIQDGDDSSKSLIWPTECRVVFPRYALALVL